MLIKSANIKSHIFIEPVGARWYRIPHSWTLEILTDCGAIRIHVKPGFLFDGRSGGPLADFVAPNLGTQEEAKAWLAHDLNGHDLCLDFRDANKVLFLMLRENCNYGYFRALTIRTAVSASSEWFGLPEYDDPSYPNLKLIRVEHSPK